MQHHTQGREHSCTTIHRALKVETASGDSTGARKRETSASQLHSYRGRFTTKHPKHKPNVKEQSIIRKSGWRSATDHLKTTRYIKVSEWMWMVVYGCTDADATYTVI